MSDENRHMKCTKCDKLTDVPKKDVPESEWDTWRCPECEGTGYGQEFMNWVADRISPSTSEDTTGRFVLRELVQNADDVEADTIVLRFCEDALYVYNNGFGFRSVVDGGPGDFERISSVLAKPKEKEFYTSGNFGSGFQTVYLFTNGPEVHSHGSSFRYDPTVPEKKILKGQEKIDSPYRDSEKRKGAVFRLHWRTEADAIVKRKGKKYFVEEEPWKRWDTESRQDLYEQLKDYLHDSLLCCQHLRRIRIVWDEGPRKEAYQAERDFELKYVDYDGQTGTLTEGPGKGGLLPDEWRYDDSRQFRYLIGSDFIRDVERKEPTMFTISKDDRGRLDVRRHDGDFFDKRTLDYPEYMKFLHKSDAIKKCDIHILIPFFPWEDRSPRHERKAWSYSVIPLPKESGNNFTLTAHLFPKQTREAFELHQEKEKKRWLEKALLTAEKLFLSTYEDYIEKLLKMEELDESEKQRIILDYLPASRIYDWINVSLDDSETEADIDADIFGEVFSKKILYSSDDWWAPFDYDPAKKGDEAFSSPVDFPRNEKERWLLEEMGFVTFSEEFLGHHRFKELSEFKRRLEDQIEMTDEKFVESYGGRDIDGQMTNSFYNENKDEEGRLIYDGDNISRDFVEALITHCLEERKTDTMHQIPVVPNRDGELLKPENLRKEPGPPYSKLRDIVPARLYPHPDFEHLVKPHVDVIDDPIQLLDGMKENKEHLETDHVLVRKCYEWIDACRKMLPEDMSGYPIVLDSDGRLAEVKESFWVPVLHHEDVMGFLKSVKDDVRLVDSVMLKKFSKLFREKLRIKMLDYPRIVREYRDSIEGTEKKKQTLQEVLCEGILAGISNGSWTEDDVKALDFLPAEGELGPPTQRCLGLTRNHEVNRFLGSIDRPLQKVIGKHKDYASGLRHMGCGDLFDDKVGHVVSTIHRTYLEKQDEDGICYLDDKEHALVSACLDEIAGEPGLRDFVEVCDKTFLPVDYRGRIALSTPPRWDHVDGDPRLEKYNRDWPWVKPKEEFLDHALKPVWHSTRFLRLYDGFSGTQDQIRKTFSMERLIAQDGTPRALMMYFIVPSIDPETSLFHGDAMERFLGKSLGKKESEVLRMSLLGYLKDYYRDSPHEGEKVDSKDKPCLYDSRGNWKKPTDFAFKIDEDLEILGYHDLHQDFLDEDGWERTTLVNLGVVDRIDFGRLEKAIRKMSSEKKNRDSDRRLLKILTLAIEEDVGGRDDWQSLSKLRWLPTKDGKRRSPEKVLAASDQVRRLVGDSHPDSCLDVSLVTDDEAQFWSGLQDEDLKRIGMRVSPTLEELMDAWVHHQKKRGEPPAGLYDYIERDYDVYREGLSTVTDVRKLRYFCDGKWRDSRLVVMEKPDDVPEPLRKRFSFIRNHERVLKWLRGEMDEEGRPRVRVQEALRLLEEVEVEEYEPVWRFVVGRRAEIDDAIKAEFSKKQVFPFEDNLLRPEFVIVPSRGGPSLESRGRLDKWLLLGTEEVQGEIETLLYLGGTELVALLEDDERREDFLLAIASEGPTPGDTLWTDYSRMIGILAKERRRVPETLQVVAVQREYGLSFKAPTEVLLRDEGGVWEHFRDSAGLHIFDPAPFADNGVTPKAMEDWLRSSGAKEFADVLKGVVVPNLEDAEHEQQIGEGFIRALTELEGLVSDYFEHSDIQPITKAIDPLRGATVYSCPAIVRRYEVDLEALGGKGTVPKEIRKDYYFDSKAQVVFYDRDLPDPLSRLGDMVKVDFFPGFADIYRRRFWEAVVNHAFSGAAAPPDGPDVFGPRFRLPDFDENLSKLANWWGDYIQSGAFDMRSLPTLEGDFWWPALGLDDEGDSQRRSGLLKAGLLSDRKLMFTIFSMATLLGTNVQRTQIKRFLDVLDSRSLLFDQIFEMKEEAVLRKMIDDVFEDMSSEDVGGPIYPDLRRRILDILILRRAMKDETIGDQIVSIMTALSEDGLPPEEFLTSGVAFAQKPFMKGFKGMFTGQIYFVVREAVRLGLAKKWSGLAFHAPSQVQELLWNLGRDMPSPSGIGRREHIAKDMTRSLKDHRNLREWFDIPFFIYCDEFCRNCIWGSPHEDCGMDCYRKREW